MKTWLTSGVGIASAAGAVAVVAVVATVVFKSPESQGQQPAAITAPLADNSSKPKTVTTVPQVIAVLKPDPVEKPQRDAEKQIEPVVQSDTETPVVTIDTVLPETEPKVAIDYVVPEFDLVRVDSEGSAVIAGSAEPGALVRIRFGAQTIQTVTADNRGAFVALIDLPTNNVARPLVLEQVMTEGQIVPSVDTVLVLPRVAESTVPPKIVMASASGVTVLQAGPIAPPVAETVSAPVNVTPVEAEAPALAAAQPAQFGLSLDTISYDKTGDVVLAGRGSSDQFVRVYVDNKPIETETVPSDGQWKVVLPEVKEGVYTLRVDEIDQEGTVTARVESPFKRETPEVVLAAAETLRSSVTVQPGHTLWALAQDRYGDGVKYVQILNANRGRIRNPNLIYPGQVFALPK